MSGLEDRARLGHAFGSNELTGEKPRSMAGLPQGEGIKGKEERIKCRIPANTKIFKECSRN